MRFLLISFLFLFINHSYGQTIRIQCIQRECGPLCTNLYTIDIDKQTIEDGNGKFKGKITDSTIDYIGEYKGKNYHVIIDRYTGIKRVNNTTSPKECSLVSQKKF